MPIGRYNPLRGLEELESGEPRAAIQKGKEQGEIRLSGGAVSGVESFYSGEGADYPTSSSPTMTTEGQQKSGSNERDRPVKQSPG